MMKHHGREPLNLNKARVPHGQLFLIPERCKSCGICIEFCPLRVLALSERANRRGYYLPAIAAGKEGSCVHCQFCSLVCPEFAIYSAEASA
ncbi:MAG TPA: 4Fe-4S binding protein [Anaerolineae bacterium]|nr:4Fe-4S binding protein [Anaerolineae bacterium]